MDHELEILRDDDDPISKDAQIEEGPRAARVELRTSKASSKFKALLWKNLMWNWRHPV